MPASPSFFHGVDTLQLSNGPVPVQTVVSSVIGIVGTARKGPVNQPGLCIGQLAAAAAVYGEDRGDGFTIPAQVADALSQNYGATLVIVNVLDGTDETKQAAITNEVLSFNLDKGNLVRGGVISGIGLTFSTCNSPARQILTATAQPATSGAVTIGTKTYTFVTALSTDPTVPNEVLIGTNIAATLANLVLALTGGAGIGINYSTGTTASTEVTAKVGPGNTVYLTAITTGTAGNSLASTNTATNMAFGATTLLGGQTAGTKVVAPYRVTAPGVVTLPAGCNLVSALDAEGNALLLADMIAGQNITITYAAGALTENTDYSVNYPDGIVTRPASGSKLLSSPKLTVNYSYIDPTTVTDGELIGEFVGGNYTGMQLFRNAKASLGVQPRILVAAGHTHTRPDDATANPVAKALEQLAPLLSAVAFLDAPDDTKEVAYAYKQDYGTDRTMVHYPFDKVVVPGGDGTVISRPSSARMAGLLANTDNTKGWWKSFSNKQYLGTLGLSQPVDYAPGNADTVANYLNMNWITTRIFDVGFTSWGNRMSDGTFITRRRTADIIADSIAAAMKWAVDEGITRGYVEAVTNAVNSYLRFLKNIGAILGGTCWCDPSLNSTTELQNGHIYFNYNFSDVIPAEHVTFQYDIVDDYVASIFPTGAIIIPTN